jgi:hypothetical protein
MAPRSRVLAGWLLGLPALASAQQGTIPEILALPPSVRSAGLGGAASANIGYAGSVFSNPAGIAPIRILSLEGGAARYDSVSTFFSGAAAFRAGKFNVGGGIRFLNYDEGQPLRDNYEGQASLSLRWKGVAWGLGGGYYSIEDVEGEVRRTMTAGGAVTVYFFDIAALAISARNLGDWAVTGEALEVPDEVRLGFSLNLVDTYSNWRLLATVERGWFGGSGETAAGLEGGAVIKGVGFVLRAGVAGRQERSPYSPGTLGGSLVLGRAAVDYAYLERHDHAPLHLFGLRWTP